MKYKAGDAILIKGAITDVHEGTDNPYFVAFDHSCINWVSEDKIIQMDKTYADGLSDAWNLLKKVYDMNCDAIEEIFGVNGGFYDVIRNFTFEDCRDKIEAYEKGKKFFVGDEIVTSMGETFIILALADGEVYGYSNDGKHEDFPVQRIECYTESGRAEKTGKHIEIESLLKKIGE